MRVSSTYQVKVAYTKFACATLLTSSWLILVVYASPFSALFDSDLRGGDLEPGFWILDSALNPLLLHFFRMYIFGETLVLRSGFVALSNSLMEVVVETPLRHPNSLIAKNETLSLSF